MRYVLIMVLFSSIVSADVEIVDEETLSVPIEKTEYITLRGDAIPVPTSNPVVIYPIEDFVRIEKDE